MANENETVEQVCEAATTRVRQSYSWGVRQTALQLIERGFAAHKRELAAHKREVSELRECLKMAIVDTRIAKTCFAFGRECDTCNTVCDAHKWYKVLKGVNGEGK